MAYSYSHLYNCPTTGLKFFTVYGPWDRSDMAMQKFAKAILICLIQGCVVKLLIISWETVH